jgi:hypothetical protein
VISVSSTLQIILPVGKRLPGQEEVLVEWGSERFSSDPRVFRCSGFELVERPVPPQLAARIPVNLRTQCSALVFDPQVPLSWGSGAMASADLLRLGNLFGLLPTDSGWAVCFEAGTGSGTEVIAGEASEVFQILDPRVRRREQVDVSLVHQVQGRRTMERLEWYVLILRSIRKRPAAYLGSLRVDDLALFLTAYALGRRGAGLTGSEPGQVRYLPGWRDDTGEETALMHRFAAWLDPGEGGRRHWAELVRQRAEKAGRLDESALVAIELLEQFLLSVEHYTL